MLLVFTFVRGEAEWEGGTSGSGGWRIAGHARREGRSLRELVAIRGASGLVNILEQTNVLVSLYAGWNSWDGSRHLSQLLDQRERVPSPLNPILLLSSHSSQHVSLA